MFVMVRLRIPYYSPSIFNINSMTLCGPRVLYVELDGEYAQLTWMNEPFRTLVCLRFIPKPIKIKRKKGTIRKAYKMHTHTYILLRFASASV